MIEIHPLRDKAKVDELYKKYSVAVNASSMAVVATDGDTVLGNCLFDLTAEALTVSALEPADDLFLADGILRAALHVGVENGVNTAFYTETAPVNIFERLEFIKNAENRELNVQKLFTSCKNCENT